MARLLQWGNASVLGVFHTPRLWYMENIWKNLVEANGEWK